MSAAKMVADSTQSDTDSRKKKSRYGGRKEKKTKKDRRRRRYSSSSSGGSSDSRRSRSVSDSGSDVYDSDVDLEKELKPLSAYLKNPPDLLDQMLHSVRGSSLQRALPDVLKDMPMEVLRKRCLEHLEVMSRKRMRRILAGDEPSAISSSGTEDEESSEDEKDKEKGAQGEGNEGINSTAEEANKGVGDGARNNGKPDDSPLSIAAEELEEHAPEETSVQIIPPPEEEMEVAEEGETEEEEEEEEEEDWDELEGADDVADVLFPQVEQDKMELLELEMRARAIKAMLALHEQREKDRTRKVRKK